MASSIRKLETHIKQCDIILYVLDARCPQSCINPSFKKFAERKPVLFVLNKVDLAPQVNFNPDNFGGAGYVLLDSTKTNSTQKLIPAIRKLVPKPRVHAMVIGVPNCGKSTLINNFTKTAKVKTENRPGVTRQPQWAEANLSKMSPTSTGVFNLFLLDTPGILYPNLEDQRVARNLAFIGSIKDDILDIVDLARNLINAIGFEFNLEQFAKKRGHILKGGELDLERAARTILVEFRSGKLGKFNLDLKEEK